ncbi:MAG: hypothetical protein INR71_14160 [Terriglobus roseus]|nr:hypothetical protein [Terriglobus roseus]
MREALGKTKIQWYPIPVGVGVAFLGFFQFQRVRAREQARIDEEQRLYDDENGDSSNGSKPRKRPRIRPTGPWCALHSTEMRETVH